MSSDGSNVQGQFSPFAFDQHRKEPGKDSFLNPVFDGVAGSSGSQLGGTGLILTGLSFTRF